MRLSLLPVCLLTLMVSTANGAQIFEQPGLKPMPNKAAHVVFSRDRNAPTACDVAILVGGLHGAELGIGESVTLNIEAGEQNILMMTSPAGYCGNLNLRNSQSLIIAPGETRYFQIKVTNDSIFIAPETQ
ncbi:MAG: hypothetical protein CMK72_18755 [Pseudomonadaceae bacterium]|nr:hypothetical protein [Pseudomonadaceae bacterium]